MVSEQTAEGTARLVISRGGTLAEAVLCGVPEGPGAAPVSIPVELCIGIAAEAGIRIDASAMPALREACTDLKPGEARRVEIAHGTPARHAEHGRIEWTHPAALALVAPDAGPAPASTDAVDHYERGAIPVVRQGETLGRLIPPVPGEDGVDVTGRTLAAREGRPARLNLDETILTDASGCLIAQRDGVLSLANDRATVRDFLEIPGSVDFSTGHVDFPGEVLIRRGVRDLFRVTAAGGITVDGLVESARLESGGTIRAAGGLAGRGKGELSARGDLEARYISGFTCRVLGSLRFEKEIIDSRIEVYGGVTSLNGAIVGGVLVAVGPVRVRTLGSVSEVATRVVIGTVPSLEPQLDSLESLIAQLKEARERDEAELRLIRMPGRRLTGPDKERLTELTYSVQVNITTLGKAEQARERVRRVIAGLSTVDVSVAGDVFPGVIFRCGGVDFRVRNHLKGPIRIVRSAPAGTPGGCLLLRQGDAGSVSPLDRWCERRAAA